MKLILTLFFIGLPICGLAKGEKIFTNNSKITWEEFKTGIPEICRGIQSKGRHIQKEGCVFWSQQKNKDWTCLIFTQEGVGNEVFAQLVKRCYQGNN